MGSEMCIRDRDLMIDNQIRHLAVMENEKLLGVVSMRDIVKKSN